MKRLVDFNKPQGFAICNIMNFHAFYPQQIEVIEKSSSRVVTSQVEKQELRNYVRG